jgi:hypothetical protein
MKASIFFKLRNNIEKIIFRFVNERDPAREIAGEIVIFLIDMFLDNKYVKSLNLLTKDFIRDIWFIKKEILKELSILKKRKTKHPKS